MKDLAHYKIYSQENSRTLEGFKRMMHNKQEVSAS